MFFLATSTEKSQKKTRWFIYNYVQKITLWVIKRQTGWGHFGVRFLEKKPAFVIQELRFNTLHTLGKGDNGPEGGPQLPTSIVWIQWEDFHPTKTHESDQKDITYANYRVNTLCFFNQWNKQSISTHPAHSQFLVDLSFHVNGLSFSLGSSAAADAAAIGLAIP